MTIGSSSTPTAEKSRYQVTVDFEVEADSPEEAYDVVSLELGKTSLIPDSIIPGQCPLDDGDDGLGPEPIGGYLEQMEL